MRNVEARAAELLREVADKGAGWLLLITQSTAYDDLAGRRYRLVLGPDGVTEVQEGQTG